MDLPNEVYFLNIMKDNERVLNFFRCEPMVNDIFAIVTEKPEGSVDLHGLFQQRKKKVMSEEESRKIIKQVVQVVREMEKKDIVHRDIKKENILYNEETGKIKLIDFGLATYYQQGSWYENFLGKNKISY